KPDRLAPREADLCRVIPKYYRAKLRRVLLKEAESDSTDESAAANDMNIGSKQNSNGESIDLPKWADCDYFCIHDYASTGASPCGWRGRLRDARRDPTGTQLLCPRCGCATLFRIPLIESL